MCVGGPMNISHLLTQERFVSSCATTQHLLSACVRVGVELRWDEHKPLCSILRHVFKVA